MIGGLTEILERVAAYQPSPDLDLIKKAYVYADKMHSGQVRKSGESYIVHPLGVADIVSRLKLDEASICAALLHDVVEDTSATVEEIAQIFTAEIAALVDGVTKLSKVEFKSREDHQAENFRKMLIAMSQDIRVILVKLSDRLHNMRTLQHMKEEARERISSETMDIYAPLANRLGIAWLKAELEDHSFKWIHPEEYKLLAKQVAKKKRERERYIDHVVHSLNAKLVENGIEADVSGRPKHLFSIYRKMVAQNLPFDEIYDVIAFRIWVDELPTCYGALGVVHATWKPVLGRFKDYIAVPKQNSYQSLHTTVVGPGGELVEIQIRTHEMHQIAEYGIAAHWKYKEGGRAIQPKDEASFTWLRQLMEWQQDLEDPTDFIETVKVDLFADEVFVYTPKGDVRVIPVGGTPVDFAYMIHTEVGSRCTGAKVNGALVPLRHSLENGDVVEITTSPNQRPSKDWLAFVKTSRARTRIRQFIRQEERRRSAEIGRSIAEKELRRFGKSLNKLIKSGDMDRIAKELKCNGVEELLTHLGYGRITMDRVIRKVVPEHEADNPPEEPTEGGLTKILRRITRTETPGIKIAGLDDVLVRFGKCCAPVPGDPVIGYVTRGRGVTIHRRTCRGGLDVEPERRIDVAWDSGQPSLHPVTVRVHCTDAPGLLANMSQAFTAGGINISQATCRTSEDRRAVNTFDVLVSDLDQLTMVIRQIGGITGVYSVERVQA
jgi:guanosine-3',5'-bis(diphosphate) 3'-pyrophosphohydrolase